MPIAEGAPRSDGAAVNSTHGRGWYRDAHMKGRTSTFAFRLATARAVILAANVAAACVCGDAPGPPCRFRENSAIFVGIVEKAEPVGAGHVDFTFRVEEAFAGVSAKTVVVSSDTSSCGVSLRSDGRISWTARHTRGASGSRPARIRLRRSAPPQRSNCCGNSARARCDRESTVS